MKAIVLFSGGLDSTTCLAMAIKKYGKENVLALSVYYGQKHKKEMECADKIIKYYQCAHQTLDLKEIFKESKCSLLESSKKDIPLGSYEEQLTNEKNATISTYVPYRNGLFLSVAASIALSVDATEIYYGAHADDAILNAYPDTSIEFNEAIAKAIYIGSGNKLTIVAPFINKSKADVVKIGLELKVPYDLTWSCYEGKDKACGKCGTCLDRLKAFAANGVKDPVAYEE